MSDINRRQAELKLLQRASDIAQPTKRSRIDMREALYRYAQARSFLANRSSGDGPLDAIEPIRRIEGID